MILIHFENDDIFLEKTVKEFFKNDINFLFSDNEIILGEGNLIINFSSARFAREHKKIIIFNKKDYSKINITEKDICVCASDDNSALKLLSESGASAITFGYNKTNTLTFSSLNNERLISLQRTVVDINGKLVEPFEFTLPFVLKEPKNELMISAIMILTGIL